MPATFPNSEDELGHIFRESEGHVADTPENRQLLLAVANDAAAQFASDQYGNEWFVKLLSGGTQAWVQVRSGTIVNAGINAVPRSYNQQTGLKRR